MVLEGIMLNQLAVIPRAFSVHVRAVSAMYSGTSASFSIIRFTRSKNSGVCASAAASVRQLDIEGHVRIFFFVFHFALLLEPFLSSFQISEELVRTLVVRFSTLFSVIMITCGPGEKGEGKLTAIGAIGSQ